MLLNRRKHNWQLAIGDWQHTMQRLRTADQGISSMRNVYCCVFLILLLESAILGKVVRFPQKSQAASPDGRYTLINVDQDREPHHVIYLQKSAENTRLKLYQYGRYADVLWAPDSRLVAVNDHGGSDFALCIIFSVADGKEILRIDEDFLTQKLSSARQRDSNGGNHHVYIHATRWLGPNTIQIQADGYGEVNPRGFKFVYQYTFGRQPKVVRR